MPAEKRRALCAVYGFARRIDDIGDGSLPESGKRRALSAARAGLHAPAPGDPVLEALADATTRFDLPGAALQDLIDAVDMAVVGPAYESFADLVVYCRRVAGSIGRLCLAIFGSDDVHRAGPLSDDLGVALQLTNILRDVREDLGLGRVYLPAEDRRFFDCED